MCSSGEYNVNVNSWNNGDYGGEEAAQGEQYFTAAQNPSHNSGEFDDYQNHHQTGVKRIKFLNEEEEIGSSEAYSSLGLRLKKTPSLINLVEQKLNANCGSNSKAKKPIAEDYGSQPMSEKLKASNFPAKYLRIGKWERDSRHEGDLVTKCYYAKKKLVWEILEGSLKKKIEIQWNDISGIRATTNDGQPGLLEIELNQPPTFHQEINPQPRKHTLWQQADDFTGSEALKHRIHHVRFAPEILGKHYKRLLDFCPRLASLSQGPFPSLPTPFFETFTRNPYQHSHEFLLEGYGTPYLPPNYQFPSFPNPQISGGRTMTNGMAHWVDNGNIQPFHSHGMVSYGGMDSLNYTQRDHAHNGNNEMMNFEESYESYENMVRLQRNLSLVHHQQQQMADDSAQHDFSLGESLQRSSQLGWDIDETSTNVNLTVQPSTIYSSATTMYSHLFPYPLQTYNNNHNM